MKTKFTLISMVAAIVFSAAVGAQAPLKLSSTTVHEVNAQIVQKGEKGGKAQLASSLKQEILKSSQAASAISTFPDKQEFETQGDWVIEDTPAPSSFAMSIGALNGVAAVSGTQYLISGYNATAARNAWAFSPAYELQGGKTYYVFVSVTGAGYGGVLDEFKVTAGDAQTQAAQTTTLIDYSGANKQAFAQFTQVNGTFTPTTSGTYYFAINHCTQALDVNAMAWDDFIVSETNPPILPPIVTIQGLQGGLWSTADSPAFSGPGNKQYAYAGEQIHYFGSATNASSASWSFSGSHTAITDVDSYKHVTVGFNDAGAHTATLSAIGDGGNNSAQLTSNLEFPANGLQTSVWNYSASDQLFATYTTTDANNYLFGMNGYYKRIAEVYTVPANVAVKVHNIGFIVGAYVMNGTNQAKTVTIRIGKVNANGAPGEVVATFTPTFGALFGTTNITGLTQKSYTLTAPITVEGSFYIDVDFGANTNAINANNRIGITANSARSYSYSNSYAYYNSAWSKVNVLFNNGNYDAAIYAGITYMPVVASSHTPETNAIGVAIDAPVTVTYNQTVTAGDLSGITINGEPASASVDGSVLTISHSDFGYETEYTVVIPAGAIATADALTWKFTTAPDPTACNAPLNLAYNNVTYTTVDLTWQETGQAIAWEVKYGAPGFNPDEAGTSVNAGTNPFTLEGLTNDITYDIYVRSVCSPEENSPWSAKVTVKTPLDCTAPVVVDVDHPWTEAFTTAVTGTPYLPTACWSANFVLETGGAAGTTRYWDRVTSGTYPTVTSHSAGGMLRYYCYNFGEGAKGRLITPAFDAVNKILEFSFYMYRDNSNAYGDADLVNIYVSPTTNIADGKLIKAVYRYRAKEPVESANGWYQYTAEIPKKISESDAAPMSAVYIIIEGVSGYGYNIFLDDLRMEEIEPVVTAIAPVDEETAYVPAKGAIDITLNAEVSVQLNNSYLVNYPSSGSGAPALKSATAPDFSAVTIKDANETAVTGISVNPASGDDTKLIIAHDAFVADKTYTVTIPQTSILGLSNDITWSFTTAAPTAIDKKQIAGTIVSNLPDGSIKVSTNGNATVKVVSVSGRVLGVYASTGEITLKPNAGGVYMLVVSTNDSATTHKVAVLK